MNSLVTLANISAIPWNF